MPAILWVMRDGTRIRPGKMKPSHVRNSLRMVGEDNTGPIEECRERLRQWIVANSETVPVGGLVRALNRKIAEGRARGLHDFCDDDHDEILSTMRDEHWFD